MKRVLLLDTGMQPIDVVSWTKAMQLLVTGRAEVVEEYEDVEIRSATQSWKLPSVLRKIASKFRYRPRKVRFSRKNILARDNSECQYCRSKHELTMDHVIPVSQGGKTTWENVVTACFECNQFKADRTPKQAGMTLIRKPVRPRQDYAVVLKIRETDPKDAWATYFYWNSELSPV